MASCDSYDDLLSKALKGIEFYTKLETNVSKLLQRIKSASKVQQEEREQMLLKNEIPIAENIGTIPAAPKLKDYLENRKKNPNPGNPTGGYSDPNLQYQQQMTNMGYGLNPVMDKLPPGVRPAPLGSEMNDTTKSVTGNEATNMQYNYNQASPGYAQYLQYYQQQQQQQQGLPISINPDMDLANRMSALLSGSNTQPIQQQYTSYTPQNYTPVTTYSSQSQTFAPHTRTDVNYSYDVTKAYTSTINSYRPVSSTIPNTSTSNMQYPDSSLRQPNDPNAVSTYSSVGYTQPSQTNTQNVNTYYPVGYSPSYPGTPTTQPSQMFPGQVQYHSLEYATSVQETLPSKHFNSIYSSPVANMTSAPARDVSFMSPNVNLDVANATVHNYGAADPTGYPSNTFQASTVPVPQNYQQGGTNTQNYQSYPTSSSSSHATGYSYPASYINASPYQSGALTNTVASGYTSYPSDSTSSYQGGTQSYQSGAQSYAGASSLYQDGSVSQTYQQDGGAMQPSYGSNTGTYSGGAAVQGYASTGTPLHYPGANSSPASVGAATGYGGVQVRL